MRVSDIEEGKLYVIGPARAVGQGLGGTIVRVKSLDSASLITVTPVGGGTPKILSAHQIRCSAEEYQAAAEEAVRVREELDQRREAVKASRSDAVLAVEKALEEIGLPGSCRYGELRIPLADLPEWLGAIRPKLRGLPSVADAIEATAAYRDTSSSEDPAIY